MSQPMNWIERLNALADRMLEAGVFDGIDENDEAPSPLDHDAQAAMDGG